MPLDFPNAPNVNDTFTSNGRSWKWDGTTWNLVPIAHVHPMADLVDFNIGTPATGQALLFNGSKWANRAAIPQASVTNLTTDLAGKAAVSHTHNNQDVTTTVNTQNVYSYLGTDWYPANSLITVNFASTVTCYLTASTSTIGSRYDFIQMGAGQLSFVAGTGTTTIVSTDSKRLSAKQYAAVSAIYIASGTWALVGNLA